jgi:natural product biosynthesis luciferase-like monooxygenase protein/amino acid adenylation domain-containing protein/FkbM family methyltransferase
MVTVQKPVFGSERREIILHQIRTETSRLLGFDDPLELDVNSSLLEMGADSIAMMEAVAEVKKTYGIQIALRQFFEELSTLDALATYIDQHLSPEWEQLKAPPLQPVAEPKYEAPPQPVVNYVAVSEPKYEAPPQPPQQYVQQYTPAIAPVVVPQIAPQITPEIYDGVTETSLEKIMKQQLQVMSQQLELLKGNEGQINQYNTIPHNTIPHNTIPQSIPPTVEKIPAPQVPPEKLQNNGSSVPQGKPGLSVLPKSQQITSPAEIRRPKTGGLNEEQKRHLAELTKRYNKRTPTSKKLAQAYRPVLADSRASIGFRPSIKEMLYPIVAKRSQGARVWDVDGNEYVDITMGQGVLLFGHQPPFIMEALQQQMELGIQLHPRHHLAGEVAQLLKEITGVERVCFSNSGTEAVMTAIRLARAATGRDKFALFDGSYHGHADTTLVRKEIVDGRARTVVVAPGIPPRLAEDIVVLDYDSPASLEYLELHGHELAAVLVEPVQSNRLSLQPKEFLHKLREVTRKVGAALIFDEITTGFRIHPGGAQAWFGVEADIVNYGKVLGGGMSIGVIAGKAQYLDGVDGGMWNYGDTSFPTAERTFFGGTFCMHPLSMAAVHAVLLRIKQEGLALQQGLNQKTTYLASTLNNYFLENEVPIEVEHFSSIYRFSFTNNLDPFFYHLVEKGVYVWEWRKYFMSTAHTDEDIEYVIKAVKDTVEDMRGGGFFLTSAPKSTTTNSKLNREISLNQDISEKNGHDHGSSSSLENNHQQGFWSRRSTTSSPLSTDRYGNSYRKTRELQFSLFYFGNYNSEFSPDKYNLLFAGAKFADQNGFTAVWLPERHFHNFGGFSPNPSVLSAALARETQQIQLRAGSVVLPLHHPLRVAEEWSIVDNLSQGRVAIAFASGWHENDFVFSPDAYGQHRELMFQNIKLVQRLWQGELVKFTNGVGKNVDFKIFPQPMQPELPIWITIVNNPQTFIRAGEIGAGVLTNLMGQKIEDLASNIQLYRQTLAENGYDPASGTVTVLLHTLVGNDLELIREKARQPMYNYMTSSIELFKSMVGSQGLSMNLDELTEDDRQVILAMSYQRYVETSALIGTLESCIPIIDNLLHIGVDEIACLIDFGADDATVLESLPYINSVREYYQSKKHRSDSPENIQFPLTEAQKQLWVLDKLGENSALAYLDSFYIELKGTLNVEAMRQIIHEVINNHEAFRTKIDVEGNYQEVLPSVAVTVPLIDFSDIPESEKESSVKQWIDEEFRKPFDLTQAPLFQIYILKLDEQLNRLIGKVHHIVADGWSSAIVIKELGALYSAYCQGKAYTLSQPMQFREYVEWENQQSQTEEMLVHEAFWIKKFSDSIPVLNLPTDRPFPSMMSYRGSKQSFKIGADLANKVRQVSRQKGCTFFMTLLAAYKVLLHRLSGDTDIVVGIPAAARSLEGSQNLVGYCVHLLPIRTNLEDNPNFSTYLKQVRGTLLDAYEHQDYPFAKLLNKLDLNRDFSRSVLVSAAFNLDIPLGMPTLHGLETSLLSPPKIPLAYDIYLTIFDIEGSLYLDCGYNLDVFDDQTIARWLQHFHTLLESIVAHPDQSIQELPLLTVEEQQHLLVAKNQTAQEYPQDKCIHHLFESQVKLTPEALAVVFEQQQLTYQQLNQRANQLARHLQALGVGPDSLVGLSVERSLEMIVGLLGILKAGGAYLPLDPEFPPERLAYMLDNAGVTILVTQQSLNEGLRQATSANLVFLDTDWGAIAQQSPENLASGVKPDNLVYVIYTSGSTGSPKGVAVEHRSLVNYVSSAIDRLAIQPGANFALVSPIIADLGNTVLYPSLCTGGQLHVLNWHKTVDSKAFNQYISANRIDYLKIVPSHLAALQDPTQPKQVLPRQALILGGEATSLDWAKSLLALQPECRIYNHYGPTETTVGVLTYCVDPQGELPPIQSLPLEQPLSNVQIYLLDSHLNPVPLGVRGEIYIGGVAVARGYLHQPELTAERFIPNPYEKSPESRLYRTGDLARYLPNGQIEFLGRIDDQVKIRGYRVELKDIETALSQHPDIEEAITLLVSQEESGNQQLVAYLVPSLQRRPTVLGIPRYKLPNNMAIAHLNKNETDYIYREIFELQAYLKHGITIEPGDCIFDVGANIGLFSLFATQICPQIKIYAFEPNPTVFKIVQSNLSLYATDAQVLNCGLSENSGTAEFTFFTGFSLLSGFYADAETEKEVVKKFVGNQEDTDAQEFLAQAEEILAPRFEQTETFTAQLRTISEIIAEQGIERIDLLKVNVEKSEFDVLKGIKPEDWQKIRQLVVEIDVKDNIEPIVALFKQHGYEWFVEQDVLLANTELCYIYAIRPSGSRKLTPSEDTAAHIRPIPILDINLLSANELKQFYQDKLPDYMMPSSFVLLEAIPLKPNGKVDRQALIALGKDSRLGTQYVSPETEVEKTITDIWQEVLTIKRVGINDNFFELGGNSLLLIQVHRKLLERLAIDLAVVDLFTYPTVKSLSLHIAGISGAESNAEQEKVRSESRDQGRASMRQKRHLREQSRQ